MEAIKKASKTMEAVSLLTSEMVMHTNEIFAGVIKHIAANQRLLGSVNDAVTNITSLYTALGIMYTTSSNVEYDRKSIGMVGLLPEKKQDFNYLIKKAKNIENEFFKFSSVLKTVIQSLQYFAKYSNSDKKYDETIGLLDKINKKIDDITTGQIRNEIANFIKKYGKKGSGDCVSCVENNDELDDVKLIKFGGNQYVVTGNIKVREESRTAAYNQIIGAIDIIVNQINNDINNESLIKQYISNFYCVDDNKKFIELSKDNTDKKLKHIAMSAKLSIDNLFNENILQEFFSYIIRHTERIGQMTDKPINMGIDIVDDGRITVKLEYNGEGEKFNGSLRALCGMFELLRNIDIEFLKTADEKYAVTDDSDKARTQVFKRISELFNILLDDYTKKYFIHGGGNDDILTAIKTMNEFETQNSERILELETKFIEKSNYADELNSLLERIMSPDKSTCVKKLMQYAKAGEKPEDLL